MARKPSFDFERRERAKAKAEKRTEKAKAKAEKKTTATVGEGDEAQDGDSAPEAEENHGA